MQNNLLMLLELYLDIFWVKNEYPFTKRDCFRVCKEMLTRTLICVRVVILLPELINQYVFIFRGSKA